MARRKGLLAIMLISVAVLFNSVGARNASLSFDVCRHGQSLGANAGMVNSPSLSDTCVYSYLSHASNTDQTIESYTYEKQKRRSIYE